MQSSDAYEAQSPDTKTALCHWALGDCVLKVRHGRTLQAHQSHTTAIGKAPLNTKTQTHVNQNTDADIAPGLPLNLR
jgi:hypothetical protein